MIDKVVTTIDKVVTMTAEAVGAMEAMGVVVVEEEAMAVDVRETLCQQSLPLQHLLEIFLTIQSNQIWKIFLSHNM